MASLALAYDHLAIDDRELRRLANLERMNLTTSADNEALDRITRLVTLVLDVPMAAISIVERDRQWLRSVQGLSMRETPRCDSFCSHVVALDDSVRIEDATLDDRFRTNPSVLSDPGVRFYLGVPLRTATGTTIGALCAIGDRPRQVTDREVSILTELAAMVADRIDLHLTASIDGLTGTMRRTAFINEASRDFARTVRDQQDLGCLMIDVDHFKAINDRHGHAVGDRVLAAIGSIGRSAVRAGDYIGRMGGEEFCIMLPGAGLRETQDVAERLRSLVADIADDNTELPLVTVSLGVAAYRADDPSVASLIARADGALFQAKGAGRNRSWAHEGQ